MRTVLTIAGSDSSAGAGIQADLKTFAAIGLYGVSAVTAITAQSTQGVASATALPADLVTAQIEAVAGDVDIHATKIGMLADAAIVEAVAAAIAQLELPLVVVDPVLASSDGQRLLDADGMDMLMKELLPRARVVTPNIPEAEALSGRRIRSMDDAREAARRIATRGGAAVIVTGGHLPAGSVHVGGGEAIDLLYDGHRFAEFHTLRIETADIHGTGCTYAAALAAHLALGEGLEDAAERAQQYTAGSIRHALSVGRGRRVPNHFFATPGR
jgi:hydroxymethylpyrimidine/phosphomethylpyrimidine kinase